MKHFVSAGLGVAAGLVSALALFPAAQAADVGYRGLDLFREAFQRVRADYVRPVTDNELISAAISGMVSSLDPHSSYMDPKETADMRIQTTGRFGGVGLEVTQENGQLKVVSAMDDTPASHAGIKSGDFISAIDGVTLQGLPISDAVEKMRGPEQSQVTLTVLRTGEKQPFQVTMTRKVIPVQSVKSEVKGDIGYIRIVSFSENADAGVRKAIADFKAKLGPNLHGYVIDLRGNPGGLLDQAIRVSSDFLNSGIVVSTRGRNPEDTERFDVKGNGDLTGGKPIEVLINGGTASAAEILAGALQDNHRASIVGETSFGKGSVQTIIPLGGKDGGALRLTTARYYTPSGRSIQATGITPDVAISNWTVAEAADAKNQLRSEASLPGHLEPEGGFKRIDVVSIRPEEGKKYDDFQLEYALDRLDGKLTTDGKLQPKTTTAAAAAEAQKAVSP
jgi:carboxyl-terminal processing protease